MLDGRRATTHWSICEMFATSFPLVEVQTDRIYVRNSVGELALNALALALPECRGADGAAVGGKERLERRLRERRSELGGEEQRVPLAQRELHRLRRFNSLGNRDITVILAHAAVTRNWALR